ncbi:MAG: orotidine 5'-phosphate decarboxylase / HUMPS family protein [Candidatus Methanomethylicaceae archaeon]
MRAIKPQKSIIIACDVTSIDQLKKIVASSYDIELVGGYKVGFSLSLRYSLPTVVSAIRRYSEKPVIYDHQKGATDVPHTGSLFSEVLTEAGVDYAILFPFSGPSTEEAWISSLKGAGITPIIGGILTVSDFLNASGGYLCNEAPDEIFKKASQMGVKDFVLPGNNLPILTRYKRTIDSLVDSPVYYLPGLGAQGGDIKSCAKIMGGRWHAIVGRSVYAAEDIRGALEMLIKDLE